MASRDDQLLKKKKKLVGFRQLLDFQNATKKDLGFTTTIGDYSIDTINMSSFENFLNSEEYLISTNNTANNSLSELPMLCKTYDTDGRLGNGLPKDFGFNHSGASVVRCKLINSDDFSKQLSIAEYPKIRLRLNADTHTLNMLIEKTSGDDETYVTIGPEDSDWNRAMAENTLIIVDFPHIRNVYTFISYDMRQGGSGMILFYTRNFINWFKVIIIPSSADSIIRNKLTTGITGDVIIRSSGQISALENVLNKYFTILPASHLLAMDPVKMYTQSEPYSIMASIYSTFTGEKILDISDSYGDDEWEAKAISGLETGITNNGDIILSYANRVQNTPIELYSGRVMETLYSEPKEIVNVPSVGKFYDTYASASAPLTFTTPSSAIDCAISILESKNNSLSDSDIPTAAVSIALGDKAQQIQSENKFNNVSLFIKSVSASGMSSDELNNIDVDYSSFITGNNDDSNASAFITLISNHNTISTKIPDISNLSNIRQRVTTFGAKLFQGAKYQNNPSI